MTTPTIVWMSRSQIAQHFGVSTKTVSRWVKDGAPHCRTGPDGGQYRFDVAAIDRWFTDRFGRGETA